MSTTLLWFYRKTLYWHKGAMDQSVGGECGRPAHHHPHQILSLPGSQHQMVNPAQGRTYDAEKLSVNPALISLVRQGIKMGSHWRRTTGSGRRVTPWLSAEWQRPMPEITQYLWATRSPKRSTDAPSSCLSTVIQVIHVSLFTHLVVLKVARCCSMNLKGLFTYK